MGLRSWLTPVYSEADFEQVKEYAETREWGISYVVQLSKDVWPFAKGSVIVAWEGDGGRSIYGLRPSYCKQETVLLENFLELNPRWHTGKKGPAKYGRFINDKDSPVDWQQVNTAGMQLVHNEEDFWLEYFASGIWEELNDYFKTSSWEGDSFCFEIQVEEDNRYRIQVDPTKKVTVESAREKYETTFDRLLQSLKELPVNKKI